MMSAPWRREPAHFLPRVPSPSGSADLVLSAVNVETLRACYN